MSSCKKYGFLSPKNIPDYEGVVPTITFDEENHNWFCVCIWKYVYSDNDTAICSEEAESLRLAKKKAFKKYREICNGKSNSNI